jgi:hypothetical protein
LVFLVFFHSGAFSFLTPAGFPGFLSSEHGCLREAGFLGFLAYDWFLAVQGGLGFAKGWFVVFFQWTSFRLLTQMDEKHVLQAEECATSGEEKKHPPNSYHT